MTPPYFITVFVGQNNYHVVRVGTEGTSTLYDGTVVGQFTNQSYANQVRDLMNGAL